MSASKDFSVDKTYTSLILNGGQECTNQRGGDLDVRGGARIKKSLCVRKNLTVQGNSTVDNLTVTGTLTGGGGFTPVHTFDKLTAGGNFVDIPTPAMAYILIPGWSVTLPDGVYLISYSIINGGGADFITRLFNVTDGAPIPNSGQVIVNSTSLQMQTYYVVTGGPKEIGVEVWAGGSTARIYLDNWIAGPPTNQIDNVISAVQIA